MDNTTAFDVSDISNLFYLKSNNPLFYITSILDILIVAYLIYKLLVIIQDTRAWQLIRGILIVFILAGLSKLLGLTTISYIFDNVITIAAISLVVLFQPEIRRALEQLGKKNIFNSIFVDEQKQLIKKATVIEEVVKAVNRLSKSYTGALIVIEQGVTIEDIAKTGVILDSAVTAELIENIFTPNTPLHDGAIIIREDKIRAAAAFLPLTDSPNVDRNLGTRHRAAIGISEVCDCLVIVVSEESGNISFVRNGSLVTIREVDTLRKTLSKHMLEKRDKHGIHILNLKQEAAIQREEKAAKAEKKESKKDETGQKEGKNFTVLFKEFLDKLKDRIVKVLKYKGEDTKKESSKETKDKSKKKETKMILLKTEKLTKTFGGKPAVYEVDAEFEAGKLYGLLGPNGSGKTTFMKMVAGLFYPTAGKITVMDGLSKTASKSKVAYMPTEPFFYDYMTVKTVGDFFKDFYEDFDPEWYKEQIEYMQLTPDLRIRALSSGMAAKLKVAVTMSRRASIYMLDEPLNGIDLVARDKIITSIIKRSAPDNTIIISSHLIDIMENLLDEVLFLKDGRTVLKGNAEEIREKNGKSIADLYKEVYA
jgi:diadenylate cyclase